MTVSKPIKMSADLLVVGGGIVGSAICRRAISEGLSVVCVEQRPFPESSATLAAGAMLGAFGEIEHSANKKIDKYETTYRVECAREYQPWLEALEADERGCPTLQKGTVIIANSGGKDDRQNIDAIFAAAKDFKVRAEWIDPIDINCLQPNPKYLPDKLLFLPDESSIDSNKLLHALRAANIRRNQGIYRTGNVVSLLCEAGRIIGVKTDDGQRYYGANVVLCCGTSINSILENSELQDAGIPKIYGGKGSSLTLETKINFSHVIRSPNRDFACGTHIVPRGNNEVYVGATNRISTTPGAHNGVTTGELHAQLHSSIHEINTGLRTDVITACRYGIRPLCIDGYPAIGRTFVDGLLVATGTYRNGVLMAPRIASQIVSIVLGSPDEQNQFCPTRRLEFVLAPTLDEVVDRGARDLVSFMQEPHGVLPYNRSRELQDFLAYLLKKIVECPTTSTEISRELGVDISGDLRPELVPEMLYEVHKLKSRLSSFNSSEEHIK